MAIDENLPQNSLPNLRVALAHDWLTGMRGGEMVLEELCILFPDADLFTIVHVPGTVSTRIESRRIIESPIVKLPGGRRSFRAYLPLFPWAVESFDMRGYDLIISSSHCAIKGLIPAPNAVHVSYVHTPMRYVWDMRVDYLGPQKIGPIVRAIAGLAAHYLRNWDVVASTRVDHFAANSNHVRKRIQKYYRRDAVVIHPPVDTQKFTPGTGGGDFFLTVSALVPYKRVDLAILACNKLGVKLVVVGDGPEKPRLKRIAGKNIEFVGWRSEADLIRLYQQSAALLFPGEEDFGIAPVESQASGTPVIAYGFGGALDTVVSRKTGELFYEQTPEALADAIQSYDKGRFGIDTLRRHADNFSRETFRVRILNLVMQALNEQRN